MAKVLYLSYDGILDPIGGPQVIPCIQGLAKKGADIVLISFKKVNRIRKIKGALLVV